MGLITSNEEILVKRNSGTKLLSSNSKYDWRTPKALFDKLDQEFKFTLDAAASSDNALCTNYFSIENSALDQDWHGNVWLNPPYGRYIEPFMAKAHNEVLNLNSECVVCLIFVRSDTSWWHNYALKAQELRFLRGRVKFYGYNNTAAMFPSCVLVFRRGGKGKLKVSSYGS